MKSLARLGHLASIGTLAVISFCFATPAEAQQSATSRALSWDAADTVSYDYQFSVLYDSSASLYRAYWVATLGGLTSEHVVEATSSVPWGFSSTPTVALETSGVRIQRFVGVFGGIGDHQAAVNQTGGSISGYTTEFTLGYLRRASGGDATLAVYECTVSSTSHFTSNFSSECTGAGATPVLLGYASSSFVTGYHAVYRCVNPSYPNDHFDSTSSTCEGSGYTDEGSIGYWRNGVDPGTSCVPATTSPGEVSPYPDGAFIAPGKVIKDGSTWYMTYTASPNYWAGGPFNQIFIATSSDGSSWTPYADTHGDPIPIQSYSSGYNCQVLNRASSSEESTSYGVGGDQIIKVGSTYYHYYLDTSQSSTGTAFWWMHATSTSPTGAWSTPEILEDENGDEQWNQTNAAFAHSAPMVVYDSNSSDPRFWLYGSAGGTGYWFPESTNSDPKKFLVSGYSGRTLAYTSGNPYITVSGAVTDELGAVSSLAGWYVYTPHSPDSSGAGILSIGITVFCPADATGCS